MSYQKHQIQREAAREQFEAFLHEKFMEDPDPERRLQLLEQFILCFVEDDLIDAGIAFIQQLRNDFKTADGMVLAMHELDLEIAKMRKRR